MIGFWIGATVLSLCALGFVLVPLWRMHQLVGRWSVLGMTAAGLLIPLTVALYIGINTWNGEIAEQSPIPSMVELVAGLESRLSENPDDVVGWRLLGQSYLTLGRYPDARQALREAWGRTPTPDNDLKLALGEAETLTDRQALYGAAGQLFEEVLATDPSNLKALWYGGLAALETERPRLARERWTALLALGPPGPVADVLRQQIDSLEGAGTYPDTVDESVQVAQVESPTGLELRLRVTLAPGMSLEGLGPAATLFIFARALEGGPPLAVIRQAASAVPGEFVLSDANAMLPGRSLADFEILTIVARLSATGQPIATPGDLYGELLYRPSEGSGVVDLSIDQVEE